MAAKQTKSQKAKLRSIAAKKGWETRRTHERNAAAWDALKANAPQPEWIVLADEEAPFSSAQRLASAENTKLLAPKTEPDQNPWLKVRAWIRRMVGLNA